MAQCIVSILINLMVSASFMARDDISESFRMGLVLVLLGFLFLSLIGTLGYAATRRTPFAVMAFIGFIVFVPIGLIGVFGMRKMMAADNERGLAVQGQET
ncbi:hypothetical protein [Caldimonas brevitalea]|uniref:Uncharacterized protein n=1 Tax=Caldimonas brevitalea TaxID=413882 RepID=A0A0G3BL78_9BURK|nr:hypothetical protein [Caldimonas brevitalea]AKJ30162.1 hypothetical protein AAW51_3471 [Caldimonas brevitalea]